MKQSTAITLETVREHLGERAATRLSRALRPKLAPETLERARRFATDVPGDRISRLKDRAAFAAVMIQLVRADVDVRRWALSLLSAPIYVARRSRSDRGRRRRAPRKAAQSSTS